MQDNDRLIGDAIGASIIDESPDTLLVRYADGNVESVSKHSMHGLLCTIDWLESGEPIAASGRALVDNANLDSGGTGIDIEFELLHLDTAGTITVDGGSEPLTLYGTELREAIKFVIDSADVDLDSDDGPDQTNISLGTDEATELYKHYESILESRVREGVIDKLAGYFGRGVEVVDDGWLVEDTYLVTYDAENYLVDDMDVSRVSGGGVEQFEGNPEAVKMSFRTDPIKSMDFGQESYTLSEVEQAFVATVEVLSHPDQYLGVEGFENEVYSAVVRAKGVDLEDVTVLATTVDIQHFVDPKTGLLHRHDVDKHTIRTTFNVRPWVVRELHYNNFDHAGVAELAWKEDQLRADSRDVFFDTDNNDDDRWNRISSIENDAPCPPEVYQRLKAMYGSK